MDKKSNKVQLGRMDVNFRLCRDAKFRVSTWVDGRQIILTEQYWDKRNLAITNYQLPITNLNYAQQLSYLPALTQGVSLLVEEGSEKTAKVLYSGGPPP